MTPTAVSIASIGLATVLSLAATGQEQNAETWLIPPSERWDCSDAWQPVVKGGREFHYMTHYSTYWGRPWDEALKQNGLYDDITRGMVTNAEIFSAAQRGASERHAADFETWQRLWKANGWPFYTYARDPYLYGVQHSQGKVQPDSYEADLTPRADVLAGLRQHAGDQWLGAWLGENAERAAMIVLDDARKRALGQKNRGLRFPAHIEAAFAGIYAPERQWTKKELYKLVTMVCAVRSAPFGGYVASGAGPLIQPQAEDAKCLSILQKNPKPIQIAIARGAARCTGKYWGIACHHMQMGYSPICLRKFDPCYPIDALRRWFLSGYFSGCGYTSIERFPDSMFKDNDSDGSWELTPVGLLFRELFDLRRRHPERGVPYTPVAILEDWYTCRYYYRTGEPQRTYRYFLPYTEEDHLAWGLLMKCIFPVPRDLPTYAGTDRGSYSDLEGADTPYGEIFDIIRPNSPNGPLPLKVLENYRVLLALDRVEWQEPHVRRLTEYVRNGGVLVLNTRQLTDDFQTDVLGVKLTGQTFEGQGAVSQLDDQRFTGGVYVADEVQLRGAEPILRTDAGQPLATRQAYGKGYVIVTTPHFLLEKTPKGTFTGRERLELRPLVCFVPYLLHKLTEGLVPIHVQSPERASLRYSFLRKGDGWVVVLMSNSFARTFAINSVRSGWFLDAGYAPERFAVKLTCRTAVADAIEWTEDRDVPLTRQGDATVLNVEISAGAVRIIELQPDRIELGTEAKAVNLALNRPAHASSEAKGHEAAMAFDGKVSQVNGWWSASGRNQYDMPLPQWLEVDLGAVKRVNRLHLWLAWSSVPALKNRFCRYVIEGSSDRETWQSLVDESRNVDLATEHGLMRRFDPADLRYARVRVTYSSTNEGAMVSELELYGDETQTVARQRKPAEPGGISFPLDVSALDSGKIVYLADLTPRAAEVGWGIFDEYNGKSYTLGALKHKNRREFPRCVYAHAASELVYGLHGRYEHFLAVAGLVSPAQKSSAVFEVYVDGVQKLRSEVFDEQTYPFAVCVDVRGAERLRLVVGDGGDGITNDFSVWADAKLVRR